MRDTYVTVPRGLLQMMVADLWAYHDDDLQDGCTGNCPTMAAVRQANDLIGRSAHIETDRVTRQETK